MGIFFIVHLLVLLYHNKTFEIDLKSIIMFVSFEIILALSGILLFMFGYWVHPSRESISMFTYFFSTILISVAITVLFFQTIKWLILNSVSNTDDKYEELSWRLTFKGMFRFWHIENNDASIVIFTKGKTFLVRDLAIENVKELTFNHKYKKEETTTDVNELTLSEDNWVYVENDKFIKSTRSLAVDLQSKITAEIGILLTHEDTKPPINGEPQSDTIIVNEEDITSAITTANIDVKKVKQNKIRKEYNEPTN